MVKSDGVFFFSFFFPQSWSRKGDTAFPGSVSWDAHLGTSCHVRRKLRHMERPHEVFGPIAESKVLADSQCQSPDNEGARLQMIWFSVGAIPADTKWSMPELFPQSPVWLLMNEQNKRCYLKPLHCEVACYAAVNK